MKADAEAFLASSQSSAAAKTSHSLKGDPILDLELCLVLPGMMHCDQGVGTRLRGVFCHKHD